MTVQWQTRSLPLGKGMDSNTAKTALPRGKLLKIINGQFNQQGGLSKRLGFDTALGNLGNVGVLLSHNQHLMAHVDGILWDFVDANLGFSDSAIGNFQNRGNYRCVPTAATVVKSLNQDMPACDAFSASGFTLLAWLDGQTIRTQVTDDYTGAIADTNAFVSSQLSGVIPAAGFQVSGYTTVTPKANAVVFFLTFAGSVASCVCKGDGTWIWSSFLTVAGTTNTLGCRAYVDAANNRVFIGSLSGDGTVVKGAVVASTTVFDGVSGLVVSNTLSLVGASSHSGASADINCPCTATYYPANNVYLVAYRVGGGGVAYDTFGPTTGTYGSTALTGFTIARYQHITLLVTGSVLTAYYDVLGTYGTYQAQILLSDLAGRTRANVLVQRGVSLVSDVITSSGFSYFAVAYYSKVTPIMSAAVLAAVKSTNGGSDPRVPTLNSATFVMTTDGVICARVLRAATLPMASIVSASNSTTGLVFATRALSQAESATIQTALSLGAAAVVRCDLTKERARGVTAFQSHIGVGGSPLSFDGNVATENNFHLYPEIPLFSVGNDVGGYPGLTLTAAEALFGKRNTACSIGDVRCQLSLAANDGGSACIWACVGAGTTAGSVPGGYHGASASTFPAIGAVVQDGTSYWQNLGLLAIPTPYAAGLTVWAGSALSSGGFYYVVTSPAGSATTSGSPVFPTTFGSQVSLGGITYTCFGPLSTNFPTANKSYTLAACYSWVDENGLLNRSALSVVSAYTEGGTATAPLIYITTARLSGKSNVRIEIYRTAGDGTTLQQINILPNQPTTDTIAFFDTVPDTTQALGVVEYQGSLGAGELPNRPQPPCTAVEVFGQRAFVNSSENNNIVYPSKLIVPGFAVAWADELAIILNGAYGAVNAIKQMDEKLIFFQDRAISYITGDGPDNTGGGIGFASPQLLPTDVGCTNPDSVVLTPVGIFFQAPKGMMLLDRNMTIRFVGEAIKNDLVSTVYSAVVDPTTHQVIFATQNASGLGVITPGQTIPAQTGGEYGYTAVAGTVFIYDWLNDAWGNWNVNSSTALNPVNSLAVWKNGLVLLDGQGAVQLQSIASVNSFQDGAGQYLFYCELAAEQMDQAVDGFGRVRGCLLQFFSTFGGQFITVKAHYNYSDDNQAGGFTLSTITLGVGHDDFEARFATRRAASIVLEITESVGINNFDLVLEGITFEIGVLGGLKDKPTSRRAF